MPDFPTVPVPSSISAPEVIDPMLRQVQDMGYEVRRARHSRPRYRYTLEWLGKVTGDMRYIRDFLMQQRLGTLAFRWFHNTAKETGVLVHPTTPVTLSFPAGHGLYHGMWLVISDPVGVAAGIQGGWQIHYVDWLTVLLNGSTNQGNGTCSTQVFLPRAVARFSEDTWPSPVKLIGPEEMFRGYFSWSVVIEEVF